MTTKKKVQAIPKRDPGNDAHQLRLTLEGEIIRLRRVIDDVRQALEDGRRGDALKACRMALGNKNAGKEVGKPYAGGSDAA